MKVTTIISPQKIIVDINIKVLVITIVLSLLFGMFISKCQGQPEMFNVYTDEPCTSKLTSVDWGNISAGKTKTINFYIRNEVEVKINNFTFQIINISPPELEPYIKIEGHKITGSAKALKFNESSYFNLTLTILEHKKDVFEKKILETSFVPSVLLTRIPLLIQNIQSEEPVGFSFEIVITGFYDETSGGNGGNGSGGTGGSGGSFIPPDDEQGSIVIPTNPPAPDPFAWLKEVKLDSQMIILIAIIFLVSYLMLTRKKSKKRRRG